MKLVLYIFLLILMVAPEISHAQNNKELSVEQVISIVQQYHPVALQADILLEKAKAELTFSRGAFDPVFQNSAANKTFDGTRYYNYNRPELNIPTWFGIEVSAGLEYLSGNRTSPEETRGETSYFGLSIPLAKNLLMDKRRAALQTAKIMQDASVIERRNILNDLVLDAAKAYWNWAYQYQVYKISNGAVAVNEQRLKLVTTAFRLGERPAIDTTEALSQLQQFQVLQSQAQLEFQNAALELNVFLWTAGKQPYDLPMEVIPAEDLVTAAIEDEPVADLPGLLQAARLNHPELLLYNYKLDVLQVEKKLKFQELLPKVNLLYNQLGKGYDIYKTATTPLLENNFQYGVSVAVPLRFSEGRASYKLAKLKITETSLQQDQKQLQVQNKVKSYFNELLALRNQVGIQEKAYLNYLALQRGEEIRFRAGESSLFLINSRENKALEALLKLQELKAKYYKTVVALQWSAGLLVP
jgi:outer membrane protein TolC